MDPTAVPTFVQHVAAFKHNLEHVRDLVASCRVLQQDPQNADACNAPLAASSNTARAAAAEECSRAVVDVREAAKKAQRQQMGTQAKCPRHSRGPREGTFRAFADALEYARLSVVVDMLFGMVVRRRPTH